MSAKFHKRSLTELNPYQQLGLRKFNFKLIARLTGMMLVYMAISLALPLAVSFYTRDGAQFAIAFSAALILMLGLFLRNIVGRNVEYELKEDESYWVTLTVWLAIPFCGTLPYLLTGGLASFTDTVFESFSGFTTTGSSVVPHPEELPESLLVYRALTQWVGGLGLMLFVVAILRKLNASASQIYEAEFSGTQQRKLHPRLARSVTRMWAIYALITLIMFIGLILTGTRFVDALCLAFSTVSTGGFVTHSGGVSILSGGSMIVVTSGINVAILYRFFTLRWRHLARNEELRTYTLIFLISCLLCAIAFHAVGNDLLTSLHYSLFHIASTMSTCGFYIPKPPHWSFAVSVLTFLLIIVGASAGSTGGGIKLRRIIILMKYVGNYITRMLHPNAVFRVKVNDEPVDNDYINKIFAFVFLYIAFIVGGAFVLTLCGSQYQQSRSLAAYQQSRRQPRLHLTTQPSQVDTHPSHACRPTRTLRPGSHFLSLVLAQRLLIKHPIFQTNDNFKTHPLRRT